MKTFFFLASLISCSVATAAETLKPCCAAPPPAAEEVLAEFSRDSLYQLDARFTDDAGREVTLASLRGRPVAITMFFASCSYACPLIVADLTRIRAALPEALREELAVVLVSLDSERDTPAVLHQYRTDRLLDASWILLRGEPAAVRELATLLGVSYKLEADGQFAHTNLITVLNREGEIVHHRTGLRGGLEQAAAALTTLAR